jgi:nitrogenase-stabilizing/protective protein
MPITLPAELADLTTAEEFLDHFDIVYDPHVVSVARLHILQRFQEYLHAAEAEGDAAVQQAQMSALLARAYEDFVRSDPLTERVFKVLKDAQERPAAPPPGRAFVPLSAVSRRPEPTTE